MPERENQTSLENIRKAILLIRGKKAIIDADLAGLYEVETKALNQAVKRNSSRFPEDYILQLTAEEKAEVVAKCDHLAKLKFSPTLPFAFTEHGAIMAATVLNSPRAVEMSVLIVRVFVQMREVLAAPTALARKLAQIENKLTLHDQEIIELFAVVREIMTTKEMPKRRKIGFLKDPE